MIPILYLDTDVELNILIDTPAPETLEIREFTSEGIFIKENLLSITTASIDVAQKIERSVPCSVYGDSVFGLLEKISHVKYLTLCQDTLGVSMTLCQVFNYNIYELFSIFAAD